MTTSSNHRSPSSPVPGGDHWKELADTIASQAPIQVAQLDCWFEESLAELEKRQEAFVTQRSLAKDLRG